MMKNVFPEIFACFVMAFVAFGLLQLNNNYAIQFIWILCCTVSYFLV